MKRYEMDLCTGALWKKIFYCLVFRSCLPTCFRLSLICRMSQWSGNLPVHWRWVPSAQPASRSRCLRHPHRRGKRRQCADRPLYRCQNDRNVRGNGTYRLYFMPQLRASDSPVWFHVRQTYSHDDEYEAGADRRCCPIPADLCFWYASAGTL